MADPFLNVNDLTAFYGDFQALFGITLHVNAGEVVAVIGANGVPRINWPKYNW